MAEEKKAKYYTIDQEKRTITVDLSIKPKGNDEKAVELYAKTGYELRIKSQERANIMKAKADNLNADKIREELKDDEEALKKFENILHGKKTGITNADGKTGFFAAKKWYVKEYDKKNKKK